MSLVALTSIVMINACSKAPGIVSESAQKTLQQELLEQYPSADSALLARGISQAAALWNDADGSEDEFCQLVRDNYCPTPEQRWILFLSLSRVLENCYEAADKLTVELLRPTQLTNAAEPASPDWIMSAYSPLAHFSDDMFGNRLAFVAVINFPHFTLDEKNTLGRNWSREEWAMARMGDVFTVRVPASVNTRVAKAYADAENYIADYNIYMGSLRTDNGRRLWEDDKVLLSHWNLRDELKALYADSANGSEKQEMIYKVMQRIVRQEIPQAAINNGALLWQPYSNRLLQADNSEISAEPEPYTRYERILATAHAYFETDRFFPASPTAIMRNFDDGVEIHAAELDSLFRALVGSEQVKGVAEIIKNRLGRDLRPYDIWYDGFKSRASLSEDNLTQLTQRLYPDADAFAADMPRLLNVMGFSMSNARDIASHIVVEPARGSGHAWPCLGRNEQARLRTRIPASGMDYKGYNIAVHEFGHCVEQVLDMYRIDHYMLFGVPNTAYTEASAFLWQQRDLQLLPGAAKTNEGDSETVLDQFWSMYEIMGVSLVDMAMWRWIYSHPHASAKELCDETVRIAQSVWNEYYEPVLGEHDCVLLAVYSHMVNAPMYLPNYPLGHIVQYQLEEHLAQYTDRADFAKEYERIYRLGRLTPKVWMLQAVGEAPSVTPVLNAVKRILQ